MRRAARVDENQQAIVSALRAAGASVYLIGLPCDALVGFRGVTAIFEFKNPESRYGKKGANENQRAFMQTWSGGPVALVDGPEAALRALGVLAANKEKAA